MKARIYIVLFTVFFLYTCIWFTIKAAKCIFQEYYKPQRLLADYS